jgi:RNA polymerase sigma factor (sigma-70 family)
MPAFCVRIEPNKRRKLCRKRGAILATAPAGAFDRSGLVEAHLYLIDLLARPLARVLPRSFSVDDLHGAGRLALVESARNYRPELHGGAPFSAYARPRIRGAMIDTVRRGAFVEAKRPSIEGTEPASECLADAVAAIDRAALGVRIAAALRGLPALERRVVLLHYEDGLRMRAIGDKYGVCKSRASQIHRAALRSLRRRLVA